MQDQLLCVMSLERRQRDHPLGDPAPQSLQVAPGLGQVHFVGYDGLGSFRQTRLILVQLIAQLLQVSPGLWGGHVQDKQQEAAALDVTQERDAQATVQVRPLDDAWDVRHWTRVKAPVCLAERQRVRYPSLWEA